MNVLHMVGLVLIFGNVISVHQNQLHRMGYQMYIRNWNNVKREKYEGDIRTITHIERYTGN